MRSRVIARAIEDICMADASFTLKQSRPALEREANNGGYTERNRVAADPAVSREWPCAECDQDCCLRYDDGKNQRGTSSLQPRGRREETGSRRRGPSSTTSGVQYLANLGTQRRRARQRCTPEPEC